MDCTICCEQYNIKDKCKAICPYCHFECCQKCIETFLINTMENANCMNCHRAWDIDVLEKMVHKTFRAIKYKNHRETILFDREKSLLPATQPEVQRVIQERKYTEIIKALNNKLKLLREEIQITQMQIGSNRRALFRLNRIHNVEGIVNTKRLFTIPCPKDNCKGFISEGEWNCGICNHYTCSKCYEYIGESKETEHTCKPENIETAKLIKKDSRSCPGCSTLIFRISGCNQMWCTQCHTAFDWISGKVEKGVVHNPHFYDYQRINPNINIRNREDQPCGGLVGTWELKPFINRLQKTDNNVVFIDWIYNLHRICSHTTRIELPRYHIQGGVNNNIELRIQYLINDINEEQFKRKLQQHEKDNSKKRDIYMILQMYTDTMIDFFNELIHETNLHEEYFDNWRTKVENLQKYANRYLEKISKRYGCVVPVIHTKEFTTYRY